MTIQYQGVWSLQSAAQLQSTQRWVTDPLFENTTLLLQADDAANGAQNNTFLDSSSNAFAITRNGGATQGTFTPFSLQPGAWSNFFNGTTDYLAVANNAAFNFGSGDFTLEAFIFPNFSSERHILGYAEGTNTTRSFYFAANSTYTKFYWYTDGTTANTLTSATVSLNNSWNHVAVSRSGSTLYLFVNGVLSNSSAISGSLFSNVNCVFNIGREANFNAAYFPGHISNVRVIKGTALYTATFTPPAAPLTNITNTSLLTCQSNRFVDNGTANSGSGFVITPNGTPSVQPFSPFAPQNQWTPSVIGGSGYFDGNGDFLTVASNAAFGYGTGNVTIEAWVYHTSRAVVGTIYASDTDNLNIFIKTSGLLAYYNGSTVDTTFTVPLNAWTHVAFVRSGTGANQTKMYANGVEVLSATNSINYANTAIRVGTNPGAALDYFTGYISNFRIVKGTAVYTGAFAPPIAPIGTSGPASSYSSTTNVDTTFTSTNTSLLLNFTNAGIFDGTMKNDFETINNAQISTAVVKYGSGSIFFDGVDDYLLTPYKPFLRFDGDFTIEFWAHPLSRANTFPTVVSNYSTFGANGQIGIFCGHSSSSTKWSVAFNGVDGVVVSTSDIAYGAWQHIAVVRQAGVMRLFFNGVSQSSSTQTAAVVGTANFWWIGAAGDALTVTEYHGYLDDLRVTAGIARYTQNFIPPSVALPRQ